MAILQHGDDRYPDPDIACFLCAKTFTDDRPVIYWSGAGGNDLYLHGGCAGTFVLRLARDAWEVENRAGDGEFTLVLRERGWIGE